jgi:DNA-binding NtrC family response regulator
LRVLQEGELERVGGVRTTRVDVRLIAATNRDLRREIAAGRFREDLFYRLNVVPIELPPLRERPEDVSLLAHFFLERFNDRLGKRIAGFEDEALVRLARYRWPGNVRELENFIERAVLFADGARVTVADLPPEVASELGEGGLDVALTSDILGSRTDQDAPSFGEGLKEQVRAAMSRVERELILRALKQTGGNVTHAARLLKVSRKGLQLKMKELDLRERGDG